MPRAIADEVPLSGSEWADKNLRQLIGLMRDDDRSDRDWATFLLAQEEADTPAVRDALLHAMKDDDDVVRAEAVLGLYFSRDGMWFYILFLICFNSYCI